MKRVSTPAGPEGGRSAFDLNALRIEDAVGIVRSSRSRVDAQRRRRREPFVKGPIPLAWLARAARLPGRALHAGVALWFLSGMRGPRGLQVPTSLQKKLGLDRHALNRALAALESSELVRVFRRPGRKAVVEIVAVDDEQDGCPERAQP